MPIEVYGDGSQISDMVHVKDVSKALVLALEKAMKGIVFDTAVEVGPYEHTTVQDFAKLVIELSDSNSNIVNLPMRAGEIPNSTVCADINTLELIDMEPKTMIPLTAGLSETIDYFRRTYF
jgi:UDP-glucose 4-epimerase